MKAHYSTKEAAELIGASKQILRAYTGTYARYLSTEATPEPGGVRKFTEADVRLLAFVYQKTTGENLTHEQVLELLAADALEQFTWQPEQPEPESASESQQGAEAGMLVPLAHYRAAEVLLRDAQRREADALEREQAMQERLNQLERELGQAQGELRATLANQRKAPAWWLWLFGGRVGE